MLSSLEELYIVLLWILPGFLGYIMYRAVAIDESERSEFDKILFTLLYSLTSYQIINSFIFPISNLEDIRSHLFDPGFTFMLLIIPTVLGLASGGFNHLVFGRNVLPKDCWYVFQRKIKRKEWVTIYTMDGLEIEGVLNYVGREHSDKELIITNPVRVIRDDKLKQIDSLPLGDEMYFNKDNISRIAFRVHF